MAPGGRSAPSRTWPLSGADARIPPLFAHQPALGSIVEAHELLQALRRTHEQPISRLARWIVERSVVHFESQGALYLPLFQFDAMHWTVHPAVHACLLELRDELDPPSLTEWFATPSAWLDSAAPATCLDQPEALLAAARAERAVIRGW